MGFNSVGPIGFESVSAVTATPSVELGTRRVQDGNSYIYVYNAGNSTAQLGMGVVVADGVTNYSCTITSLTGAGILVGVVKHNSITTGAYGWVVTDGFVAVEMAGTSATVLTGGALYLAADGLFAPVSSGTDPLAGACGKALNTIITAASGSAFIKAL